MKREEFIKTSEDALMHLMETLKQKGKEYSKEYNAFANFENGVGVSMCDTRDGVLWHYMVKHIISIRDIVTDLEIGGETRGHYTKEYVDEKIGDNINYLLLLRAMLLERLKNTNDNNNHIYDTGSY